MSILLSVPGQGRRPVPATLGLDPILACTILLFPFALALCWPHLAEVWRTGTFFDTDDAMRMVEVRDWLGGQAWFDRVAHRLHPPQGLAMHWSRIVDVPLGILIRLGETMLDQVAAERLARLVFPLALQVGMVAATAWVATLLAGPAAALPGGILVLLSGIGYVQFQPGRIDHHAPQILLLMLTTGTTLVSLASSRARWAALSGLLVAFSLAISLENLPFFAVTLVAPVLSWVAGGAERRGAMLGLAAGLGVGLPAMMALTIAPADYGTGACDAYSMPHLVGLLTGAAGLVALWALSPHLRSPGRRLVAAGLAGLAAPLVVHATYPACLADPYAGLDPLITTLWLSNVTEAQPLLRAIALRPDTLTLVACPILTGFAATLVAVWRTRGLDRGRWLLVAALVATGLAGMMWELRVATSVSPLAVLPGAWIVAQACRWNAPRSVRWLAPTLLLLPFSVVAWAMVPTPDLSPAVRAQIEGGSACRSASEVEALAALPAATILAPIDAGSHLLAHTRLSVVAAPYHRNQEGNGLVLRAFTAGPLAARPLVGSSGATLLGFCPLDPQMLVMAGAAPQGLAHALLAGEVPAWLVPVPVVGTSYRIFRVDDAMTPPEDPRLRPSFTGGEP